MSTIGLRPDNYSKLSVNEVDGLLQTRSTITDRAASARGIKGFVLSFVGCYFLFGLAATSIHQLAGAVLDSCGKLFSRTVPKLFDISLLTSTATKMGNINTGVNCFA
jgi:hypothetical protein